MNRDIQQLLPFYLNGTLTQQELKQVEEALQSNPQLQQELALLKQIQHEVKHQESEFSPGEFGLKRLQKEIAQSRTTTSRKPTTRGNRGWQLTAAAACLIVLLQSGYMLQQTDSENLTPAGGSATTQAVASLAVTFAPDAQEQDIRALLLSVSATIVDGPSALGVYRLAVRGDTEKALRRLQAQSSVIDSVQLEHGNP